MDSLLNPKEYEMLGSIEVRADDWAQLRRRGRLRFIRDFMSRSLGARIGAWALFFVVTGYLEKHAIEPFSWYLIFLGAVGIGGSIIYSIGAWTRLEARFAPVDD